MADITLEMIQFFSDRSSTTVIVDAPLFGIVNVMHGQIVIRGHYEAGKIGNSIGFPPHDQIVAEASRFWIQHASGVRERKTREEMARLLRDHQRIAGAGA
jgi:predicted GNAT superfamily acetyltransferase